jgi:HSP20 family protein
MSTRAGPGDNKVTRGDDDMVMRFDPFREMDRVASLLTQQTGGLRQNPTPMDAYRSGDQFIVNFDLPGVDPSSIDLTVEKNVLTVRAERMWTPQEGEEVIVQERPQGVFTRQIFLGEGLDTERVQATYDDGVLTLVIPVAERAKPRKVDVIVGQRQPTQIETTAGEPQTTG